MTTPRENHPVLSVQNLTIGIPSSRGFASVVEKIHFSLESGSILGIAGESGSGKTLTACAIAGLLPAPLAIGRGRVLFAGRPAFHPGNGSPAFVRGKDVLLLFQSPGSALDPGVRAGIQIQDALTACLGCPRKTARQKAFQAMAQVGLDDSLFGRYPFQLSGGQRQRVLMAMAFALAPRVLIADEPTAGQDAASRDHLLMLLTRLAKENRTAIILISHDLRILSRTVDGMAVFHRGRQVESGPVKQLFTRPAHPHTQELIQAMQFLES
ncbi:MAG TPA: ABC transporter ATP-binding protein [Desulfotignum sp.]|nr:ABC transporter ATP-binding protein [Desulfotignum sp.]